MRIRTIACAATVAALAAIMAACAGTSAPTGWLSPATETQREAFGAWIQITFQQAANRENIDGELIAVEGDIVYILVENTLKSAQVAQIKQARLTIYNSQPSLLALWTLVGTLSTISHGIGLVISAPIWIICGTMTTSLESYAPRAIYPQKSWDELRKFARFPQGLPPDLDNHPLKSK
jgi:hypothetical protein